MPLDGFQDQGLRATAVKLAGERDGTRGPCHSFVCRVVMLLSRFLF